MKTQSFQWRRSAVAVAVGLCVMSGASYGQSNTTGNIYGQVTATAGVTIVIENVATGVKRTLTPDASGRFVANSLPTGTYKVTQYRNGAAVGASNTVEVLIGQGSEVAFADTAAATQTVQVVGKVAQIDVSSSNNGATFTGKQLAALPIARNVDAIIQLAPNTTRADPRYAGGASMGGGAPSENSYYINGFPVTNPLSQLGSSELPFGAIGQAQILTGGFGAEFGRSTGGVVNITTKSGTNTWEAGAQASYTPNGLRAKSKDIMFPVTGDAANAATDGTLYRRRSQNVSDDYTIGGYVGGPLIQDTLFMFVAMDKNFQDRGFVQAVRTDYPLNIARTGWEQDHSVNDRYMAKFDWNLTNDHRLEATLIGDRYATQQQFSGYDYATGARNHVVDQTNHYTNVPNVTPGDGAASQILKYTGYLTDDLTVTALYGQSKSQHLNTFSKDVKGLPQTALFTPSAAYGSLLYPNSYAFPINSTYLPEGAEDKVKSARFDLEYRLGDHSLRGGFDQVRLKSVNAGESYVGGSSITYRRTTATKINGVDLAANNALSKTVTNADGTTTTYYYYARERIFSSITPNAQSNQSAQYIEDKWQVSKDFTLTAGLRNEQFENKNGKGQTFLKIENQLNPRLAFAWDALGDSSTKVYGSAGRYAVQIPTHIAVRGASASTLTYQHFTYQSVDPITGQPIGRKNLTTPYSPDGELGQDKDPRSVAAQKLRPNNQDELTLGIEKSLSESLNVGGSITYRRLNSTIDDFCDPRPFQKWADDHGVKITNDLFFSCASFNPGKDNDFLIDFAGAGNFTKVHLTKEDLGFDTAKRTYLAINLFAEHPMKDGWYGKVSYVYSKNKGNTEGQTLSDVGQTDVSATQTWDHRELMEGAYGYLPNDRRHQIKAFGVYQLTSEVDVGANVLLAAGRPRSCFGNYGGTSTSIDDVDYGSSYHYCATNGVSSPSPRGSLGTLPWDKRLDLNVTYKPEMVKGLYVRTDVFNVLNAQVAQAVNETHEVDYDSNKTLSSTYGRVLSYTAPRSVKFTVGYDKKF